MSFIFGLFIGFLIGILLIFILIIGKISDLENEKYYYQRKYYNLLSDLVPEEDDKK